MKAAKLTLVLFSAIAAMANAAAAQQLRQPLSIQTNSFNYFTTGTQTTPSAVDVAVTACGCDEETTDECDTGGCDAAPSCDSGCCAPSCGCGLNFNWCCLGDAWTLSDPAACIQIGGWSQGGYSSNEQPFSVDKGDGSSFNDATGNWNLHSMWVYAEKAAQTDGCCWDWGFRADVMYGTDSHKMQAFGNTEDANGARGFDNDWDHGRYGWALPQIYGELAVGNLSVIAGHFFKIMGYEAVPAPENFFYSRGFTMFNAEPRTHTGVLATYSANDHLTLYGGWTLGWDTGFDQFEDGNSFLGGFSVTNCCETMTFTYLCMAGDLGWRGDNGYNHSLVLDLTVTDRINYVIQSDLVETEEFNEDTSSITQYLFYTVNDCVGLGARVEYFNDDFQGNGLGDVYQATFGVNIKPHANVVMRPEVRYNWNFPAGAGLPDNHSDLTVLGFDTIFSF